MLLFYIALFFYSVFLLTQLQFLASDLKKSKRSTCRCGQDSKKSAPKRRYRNGNRCRCLREWGGCSRSCKCSGLCGGKICKQYVFTTNSPKRKTSKEKTKHVLQKTPKKLTSTDSTNQAFRMNFLEICFLSAIILHFRNVQRNDMAWNAENVNEMFLLTISNLRNLGIVLPLNRWSVAKIEKELRKLKKHFDSE